MKKWIIPLLFIGLQAKAQLPAVWDLKTCVEYAKQNNISVKRADVQARIADLQLKQAKLFQYPSASFNTNIGPQFGRSIDPTTNSFTNTELFAQSYSLQGGVQLFQWGRIKHGIEANRLNAMAALADVESAANDVSLNVATAYLQVLGAKEQLKVFDIQIQQTKTQIDITRKRVEAGSLPEINLVELEAQLANDSSNYINTKATFDQNVLSLKALLNLDAALPFEVATPPVNLIPLLPMAELQPEQVYALALNNQPIQKANDFRLKSAKENILSNKATLYPSITANYSLVSIFNNRAQSIRGFTPSSIPSGKVTVAGVDYTVFSPVNIPSYGKTSYTDQLNQNFRQNVGLGLSIPIFNNGQNRINYETSKLNYRNAELQVEQANVKLKQDIYVAYTNVVNALQRYNASTRSVESAQKAYDFAVKRYEVGLLNTLELITNQNNLSRAKLQALINQFDYVFRMKLLEFYKGKGLTL